MEESIAQREDVMGQSVNCARSFTLIERNQLFVPRLNNNYKYKYRESYFWVALKHNQGDAYIFIIAKKYIRLKYL